MDVTPSPRSPRRSLCLASGLLLWAFAIVIPLIWLQERRADSSLELSLVAWMAVPLIPLFIGVLRRSAWVLLTVFPMSLLVPLVIHPLAASPTVHGWGSMVAVLGAGILYFWTSSRIADSDAPGVEWRSPIRNAIQGARTILLIAIPLGVLQGAVLSPQWLVSHMEDPHEQLPTTQSLLLVFAAIVWVVTARLHRRATPASPMPSVPRSWRPFVLFAICLLLAVRALLTPENA
jgi:hypothetical protein